MAETGLDLSQYITVTQRTGKVIKARHAGQDYVFVDSVPQIVKYETACHIFGLDNDDKTPALSRLGWARSSDEIEEAVKRLDLVQFTDVSLEATAKSSDARPFVNAGESSGPASLPAPDASLPTGDGGADL